MRGWSDEQANAMNRFSPEVRSRGVRMVFNYQAEHASKWAAINSIAGKIGCTGEMLRSWIRQAERDGSLRGGPTTEDSAKTKPERTKRPSCYYSQTKREYTFLKPKKPWHLGLS